ncbi:MAG: hypothetical protein J6A40_04895 [Bacteroides sp.]|nr:hypothetical protein [Bacteroides sp.]
MKQNNFPYWKKAIASLATVIASLGILIASLAIARSLPDGAKKPTDSNKKRR